MQYYSVTDSGIARDENVWHYHPNYQEDRFLVAQGSVVVAVADNDPDLLLIPKKTLHGFIGVSKEKGILLNYPTGLYNPEEEGRMPYVQANVNFQTEEFFRGIW